MGRTLQQKPPRIGAIGCGYWGKNLVRNFAELGALGAVCDSDGALAAAFSAQYDVPARQWQFLLESSQIDGIAVAAPAALHARLTREALEAGKHVFVEKPLALKVHEAESLCAIAERADRRLMVGHLLQYHPAFLKLKSLVHEGCLGRLQYIYSNRLNLGKVRREENILWSFAPHDISMILSLVGEEPDRVDALGGYFLHKTIADVTTTHLAFPSGVKAHVFVSWLHPFKEQKLVVVAEDGMAVFDDGLPWDKKLQVYPHKIEWIEGRPQPARATPQCVAVEQAEPLKLECQHFLDCIGSNARPRTDGREGLQVLRVLDSAEKAMQRTAMTFGPTGHGQQPNDTAFPGVTIHESAYIDTPCAIGEGTKIWHFSHVLKNVQIGRDCTIGQNVMLGPDVTVGDRCKVQNNVSLYKGVTLEDGVFCGPSCVFTNVSTPRAEVERKDEFRPTIVRRGATIGANATIVCGHEIGAYSLIAAGAVVVRDVPAHALVAGVPARRIGWVSHSGDRLGSDLICPRTGRRYRECGPEQLEEVCE